MIQGLWAEAEARNCKDPGKGMVGFNNEGWGWLWRMWAMQQNWGEGNNHEVHSEIMSYWSFLPSILKVFPVNLGLTGLG